MKIIKTYIFLLFICFVGLLQSNIEASQNETSTSLSRTAKRRKNSLSLLVEADAAVIPAGQEVAVVTPSADATHLERKTVDPAQSHISAQASNKQIAQQNLTGPFIAQTVNLNDGEDDDYDDLSDETQQQFTQSEPIQEVIEQVVSKGPGFVVEEKTIEKIPDYLSEDVIEFQFEDADLENLVKQVSDLYGVTFIPDDAINPIPQGGKAVKGNKITFRTEKPLSKKQAWNLFQTFLDVAGLALVPLADPSSFRIVKTEAARKAAIPTFIGVNADALPDSDQMIRYMYFVQNISVKTLESIINELRSPSSGPLISLQEMNAFVLTDKAYNIKSLMLIISELDKVSLPQAMSVVKLKRANASDVKAFYDSITKADDKNISTRLFSARRQPTALYFPENVRIIAEPRTNSLILLGAQDAIQKIETFIATYVDTDIGKPYSPLRVYTLKYADASTVASIMTDLTQFGKDTPAGKAGGVRDGDKYMRNMTFTPELATNRIIIRGDEEDYMKAREILDILDEPQKQVAIEVLVISVNLGENRNLGTQLRSAQPGINGLVGDNVKFQTSGSNMSSLLGSSIVTNNNGTGVNRLLGNLITLATGAFSGNTLVTLGSDKFGVWGIFNILQTVSNAQIVANPFLVATNKQPAKVSIGELRRVVSGTVAGATGDINSFTNDLASLSVDITPQINSDGMIVLDLLIKVDSFVDQLDLSSATQNKKSIKTTAIVADREVLALGGLIKNQINQSTSKLPLLANIPVIGWLFKNKLKTQRKDSLLILVSSRIINPEKSQHMTDFTQSRVNDYVKDRDVIDKTYEQLDPVQRFFFNEKKNSSEDAIDTFLFERSTKVLQENIEQKEIKEEAPPQKKKRRGKKTVDKNTDAIPSDVPVVPHLMEAIEQKQIEMNQPKQSRLPPVDTYIEREPIEGLDRSALEKMSVETTPALPPSSVPIKDTSPPLAEYRGAPL